MDVEGPVDEWGRPQPVHLHEEGRDWELVHELGWDYQQLTACPMGIRRLWTGFLMEERAVRAEEQQGTSRPEATAADAAEAQDVIAAAAARVAALEDRDA